MTVEILVGLLVVLGFVAYIFLKKEDNSVDLEPTLKADKVEAEKAPAMTATAKKPTKKKATQKKLQDDTLQAMSKAELLEVAKLHSIKANASLKKAELIERIKNG